MGRSKVAGLLALILLLGCGPAALADHGSAPPNDRIQDAMVIGSVPFEHGADMTKATAEWDEPTPPCEDFRSTTVWYRLSPAGDVDVVAKTLVSDFDTFIAVWELTPGGLVSVTCSDDAERSRSMAGFTARSGATYLIQVGGWYPASGHLLFRLRQGRYVGTASNLPLFLGAEVGTGGDDQDRVTAAEASTIAGAARIQHHETSERHSAEVCSVVGFSGGCGRLTRGDGRTGAAASGGIFPVGGPSVTVDRGDAGGGTTEVCLRTWPVSGPCFGSEIP